MAAAKGKLGGKSGRKSVVAALERSPSHLLHRALQLALDIYAEEVGDSALTQRQYAVLAAAAAHEGATQTDLVRITGIDRSTLADMAARMIGRGLLERERSQLDARANAVTITDHGRAALEDVQPKVAAADARLLKLIARNSRRETFLELLGELVAAEPSAPASEPANDEAKTPKAAKPPKSPKADGKKKKKKAA
ncbi:MarR family winged helix-turn-helix transcriptional regulator [Phenylobacterium sp.]|uniref:MarR family winged helix-turn-helix transcriptional regulator n=1 Tax=Phenylobacterium sp. TaxID=1871053 RepID=UPI002736EEAE|nr:MarR family winged helix-turn-helix transcriptional regulator [Phenylobacterium sp.]MDP3659292.1 MarR family winged helix-turn-helix transcriptional regulator [Phenylobacterium sp.]